jgi:hypothetical protein
MIPASAEMDRFTVGKTSVKGVKMKLIKHRKEKETMHTVSGLKEKGRRPALSAK